MKKWYRNNIVKAILTGLAHIVSVVLIIALIWILACPSAVKSTFSGDKDVSYSDTEGFAEKVYINSIGILNDNSRQNDFETDGKVDRTKIVDVEEYWNKNRVTNQNENGIAYTMDELIKWAEALDNRTCGSSHYSGEIEKAIVVCQKEDGSYEYFYSADFKKLVETEELQLVLGSSAYSETEILFMAEEGTLYSGNGYLVSILDNERRVKYTDCWSFDGTWMEELYAPQGAESILDIVNTDSRWNGRLSEAFEMIHQVAWGVRDAVGEYEDNQNRWDEGNTNLSYIFADLESQTVYSNKKEFADYEKLESSVEKLIKSGKYVIVSPTLKDFDTNMVGTNPENWLSMVKDHTDSKDFVYAAAVDTTFPVPDEYAEAEAVFMSYAPYMSAMVVLAIVSVVILIVCIVWLTIIAGRRPEDEEVYLYRWDKWKTEISAILVIGVWVGLVALFGLRWGQSWPGTYYADSNYVTMEAYSNEQFIIAGITAFLTCTFFLVGYLSLVRRIKAGTLWKDSLTRSVFNASKRFTVYVIEHVPVLWKTVIVFCVFLLVHWIAMSSVGYYNGGWIVLAIVTEMIAYVWLLNKAIGRRKIRKGIERISTGDVDYKISLEHLHGQQLEIAEMVNNIGDGLLAAVEKSMKSERLKTDLITNVSHDIKTPLTSIINYIDLLKRENFTDPKVQGYLEILEAKAQRLKTLTEDVVEASKVSSGNITLDKMKINLVEMIQQTSGEFEEKFKNRGLKEVLNLPDQEAVIFVDGRRMWRVLENIYNNAAKYAMEGTRVYADLRVVKEQVVFSLKNISEQPLNIDADELTERFIRGDISRNTEGSGLGLSIAKNLTEMQGGKFELYLDGDLFKVTISFPEC